jgi:hypothetical protein
MRDSLFCGAMPTRTSCTTRGRRDGRGMSRKARTRLGAVILGRLPRVHDRREAGPNVPPSPFCLLFLEAPRGLRTHLRATAGARTPMTLGARGVHDAGVQVESSWSRSAECRPPSGEAWQLAFSWRPVNSGASVSRAASRTPGHRPERASDQLAGDDCFHGKHQRAGGSASSVRTAQLHGYRQ